METPGGRKIGFIIWVFFLTELSAWMVNRLEKVAPCLFGQMYAYINKQNVKMELFGPSVELRSLNIR